ncbi:MAG: AAA family ATPase [Gemmatimonadota bacterium]
MPAAEIPANALVILVGPSGCGKSTFARRRFRDTEVVSSDECRRLVSDDEANQAATAQAFEVFHAILRGRLSLGRLAVADATNLSPGARARLREEAARWGAPAVVLALDVPLATCLAQNQERARRVPPEVIELHYAQFAEARGALAAEGYDAVHVVGPEAEVAIGPPVRKAPPPRTEPSEPGPPAAAVDASAPAPPGRVGLRSRTRPVGGAPRPSGEAGGGGRGPGWKPGG